MLTLDRIRQQSGNIVQSMSIADPVVNRLADTATLMGSFSFVVTSKPMAGSMVQDKTSMYINTVTVLLLKGISAVGIISSVSIMSFRPKERL